MIIRDEKIKSIDSLSQVAEKLYIDGNKKCNITKKSVEEAVNKEEIIKSAYDYKKKITPLSDINRMSPQELQVSLRRITEIPQQPFSFLMDISKAFSDENHSSADTRDQRPSNIDVNDWNDLKRTADKWKWNSTHKILFIYYVIYIFNFISLKFDILITF